MRYYAHTHAHKQTGEGKGYNGEEQAALTSALGDTLSLWHVLRLIHTCPGVRARMGIRARRPDSWPARQKLSTPARPETFPFIRRTAHPGCRACRHIWQAAIVVWFAGAPTSRLCTVQCYAMDRDEEEMLLLMLLGDEKPKQRSIWVQDALQKRGDYGEFYSLFEEERANPDAFQNAYRMCPGNI